MIDFKIIGSRIKEARNNKKYTQQNIAEILDVSIPYISKIETGEAHVNLKRLSQIADILEIDISDLLSGTNASSKLLSYERT